MRPRTREALSDVLRDVVLQYAKEWPLRFPTLQMINRYPTTRQKVFNGILKTWQ